ncbi:MAG: hypothetical protein KME19_04850 [Microcoleus vaginatus WJT46-NPBG5]|jgi:hypothetical protein|nr:hypothetical protein [Microcoleus vaginatus WJT46-NPBG5]
MALAEASEASEAALSQSQMMGREIFVKSQDKLTNGETWCLATGKI